MSQRFEIFSIAAALGLAALPAPALADEPMNPEALEIEHPASFRAAHGDFLARARRFTQMIELRANSASGMRAMTEHGAIGRSLLALDATLPIPIAEDSFVIAGGFIRSRGYRDERSAGDDQRETIYGAGLRLGFGTFVNDDLLMQAVWQPSMFTDGGSSVLHLRNGTALATYRATDTLFLKAGVAFMQSYEDSGLVPLAGVSWLFAGDWRLDVLLPRAIEVSYSPAADYILRAGFESEREEYRVRAGDSAASGKTLEHRFVAGGIYRLTERVSFSLDGGVLLGGTYEWLDGTGMESEGKLEEGLFASLALGWTF